MRPPIVLRGRVTQLGEDDDGRPAAWIDSGDRAIHKVHVSRAQCAQLASSLFGEDVEIEIRLAATPGRGGKP